ncbi:MAG TPA: hypothetical protein PKK94_26520 [Leptospiraceae bacterium]|nr:hypothetical protein [Leptospiraceae bacterium]
MGKKKKYDLTCTKCGEKFQINVNDMKPNAVIHCTQCDTDLNLGSSDAMEILKELKKENDELEKKLLEKNDLGRVFDKTKKRMDSI